MKRKNLFLIACLVFTLITFPPSHYSQADEIASVLPEDNLLYPVILALDNGMTGSGFYLNSNTSLYFVTARHVLGSPDGIISKKILGRSLNDDTVFDWLIQKGFVEPVSETEGRFKVDIFAMTNDLQRDYPNEFFKIWDILQQNYHWSPMGKIATLQSYADKAGQNSVMFKIDLTALAKQGLINYSQTDDVAIAKVATVSNKKLTLVHGVAATISQPGAENISLLGLNINNLAGFDQVHPGNEVFIFGHPTSLPAMGLDFSKPLLRRGSIAGKDSKTKKIILDASVYFGDSGGLVIEMGADKTNPFIMRFKAIGIVQGIVPFVNEFKNQQYGYSNFEIENSGYCLATSMDALLDLISKVEGRKYTP